VANETTTVVQKAKKANNTAKMTNGWKNKYGRSPRHALDSLKSCAIKEMRLRITHTSSSITNCQKKKKNELEDLSAYKKMCAPDTNCEECGNNSVHQQGCGVPGLLVQNQFLVRDVPFGVGVSPP